MRRDPSFAPEKYAPRNAGGYIFKSAEDLIKALGWADPDPEFTRIYQKAHCENENRKAEAAYQNVAQYARTRDWRK